MKEIKAFIRQHRIADVLEALRDSGLCNAGAGAGCYNVAVSRVQRPLADADPTQQHFSMDLAEAVVQKHVASGLDVVSVLPGFIFGPGDMTEGWWIP